MNGLVIFLAKGDLVHPRLKDTNLVTHYGLPEVSCLIPKIVAYTDYDTRTKVTKVIVPGIRKMKVSNVALYFAYFIISINNSLSLSLQVSADNM